jgi:hypothetical protein
MRHLCRRCGVVTVFRKPPRGGGNYCLNLGQNSPTTRPSPTSRGYDSRWRRRSEAYRKRFPFCARCFEIGLDVFADVVDHKYPVRDGGPMHPPDSGIWPLCMGCHGWKERLEEYARSTDQMDRIIEWCDDPGARPRFRGDLR